MTLPDPIQDGTRPAIISGGQTGVDRGALDAALQAGHPCGGWVPEGRMAEDGPLAAHYPVTVLPGAGYQRRTRQNVIDSDATVIVYEARIEPGSGTEMTVDHAKMAGKPILLIDSAATTPIQAARQLITFCDANAIGRLNVAGPRESGTPGAYAFTKAMIATFLQRA